MRSNSHSPRMRRQHASSKTLMVSDLAQAQECRKIWGRPARSCPLTSDTLVLDLCLRTLLTNSSAPSRPSAARARSLKKTLPKPCAKSAWPSEADVNLNVARD